ncbi:hypothetical protein EDB86DRAFT_3076957 [Lactarius hatsudake]|nr:hypothetical protein EDB86DRAFT_3076957 [Lactarius hatsudake]
MSSDRIRLLLPRISPSSDYLTGTVDVFLTSTAGLQGDVQITRDVDVDPTMPLGLTFSFPVKQMVLDKYEKFISGMYLSEIMRDTLLTLCLKRQEIVQEHFSYKTCKVSLRDAVLVVHRSVRLSTCPVAIVVL